MVSKSYVLTRLEAIERELNELRMYLASDQAVQRRSLFGILKGVEFTEEEIDEAKRSLFRDVSDDV